jgi:uncharacterized phage-associated protein
MLIPSKDIAFTKDQIDKVGNTIIYLSKEMTDLTKTKILKILFLLEEASIKKYGYPFFGIDFQIWKLGPVVKDIFIDLSEESPGLLSEYITRDETNVSVFRSVKDFNDDEFSDNDMELLQIVTSFVKDKNASALVKITHSQNSLWRKSAIKNGVMELLEEELINSTEYNIDFSLLFENNPDMIERFEEIKENLEFSKHLKS